MREELEATWCAPESDALRTAIQGVIRVFREVGPQVVERRRISIDASDKVIADAVYVLTSRRLYNMPRSEVALKLSMLVQLPNFHVQNRQTVLHALQVFEANSALDFEDAMIVAQMHHTGVEYVYSYDRDFDLIPGARRREP